MVGGLAQGMPESVAARAVEHRTPHVTESRSCGNDELLNRAQGDGSMEDS